MNDRADPTSELERLRRENDRLRRELAAAGRMATRRDEAQAAVELGHAGRLAASEARTTTAEVDARSAWARASELGTSLGRRIAEGRARLIALQRTVASLEHANEHLVAGQAAVALREADLRALVESAVDCAIVTTDRNGLVLSWNSGARRLLGWDETGALTMDMAVMLPPEERAGGTLAADVEAAVSGTRVSREGWLLRQDGGRVWAGIEAMAIRADGADAPVGVLWMLRDRGAARQVETALRDSEARHRLLIESWAQAVWEADADGGGVADSPSWRAFTGQTPEECSGCGWLDAIHPDDRTHAEREWREAVAARGLVDAEVRLRTPDGGWRWTNVRAAPVPDAWGRVAKWVGMNIDIDARRRAEAALRESEERHRTLFETIDEGYLLAEVLLDAGGKPADILCLEANPAATRIAGRDLTGRRLREVDPDCEECWIEAYAQVALTGELVHGERYARPHGRWFEFRACRVGGPGSWRVAVAFQDVTARHRAGAALRESEARLRLALEAARAGVWTTDLVSGRSRMDATSAAMFGLAPERAADLAAADRFALIHPDDRAAVRAALDAATAREDGRCAVEYRVLTLDGSERWVDCRGQFERDPATGTALRIIGVHFDATERKAAAAALRARDERLRNVLDGMAEGFGLLAPDFTILEHNLEALRMDGRPREEIVGRSHWDAYPGTRDTELGRLLDHAMKARVPVSLEHRYGFAHGRALWLDMRAYPTSDGALAVFWRDVTARKAAEAALQEQERRYRTLIESIDEGFCIIEMVFDGHGVPTDFVFLETNPVFEQQAGFRIVPGQRIREIAPDHEQQWFDIYGRIALTGEPARFEHRAESFGFLYDVCAFRVDAPELRRVAVLFRNITARKRAEDALRESEERFRSFAENSADVLWMTNRDGSHLDYLSPAFERTFGEPRDRSLADLGRFRDLLHPDDRDAVAGLLPRVLAGETAIAHYRVVRPCDGRVVHLRDTGFPIRDDAGAVARAAGIVQDISDLHDAAMALEAEKERFRTLAEGIPQLVWRAAPDGGWTWTSPRWRAHTGQTAQSSGGFGWLDAVHPDDRDAARAAWARAAGLGVYEAEFRLRRAGCGGHAWFQARGVLLRDAGGSPVEWIGACADIDEQVRAREVLAHTGEELEARVRERTAELMAAEESLRQAQKMEAIGQLTGGIAHDFNNMLQGVSGALAMAQRRLAEGRTPDAMRYIQAAGDAATRAAGLTRRLLAFARRQRLDPRPVDPDALVGGMGDLLRRTMGPSIAVGLALRDGAGQVLCDPSELESAVLNLCINARDAMPQGGRLTIATADVRLAAADIAPHEGAAAGDYVSIRIEDTGTGMTPEVLEHVLEPFFTTKPQGEGTGLGLSQVHGFVRQSGGVLRIASAPGRGTTVSILLPLTPAEAVTARRDGPAQAAVQQSRGETVLMVDDEAAVRGPAAEHLRDLGYRVVEANDGPTALRLLDEGLRPDVLVTDVGMPNGMDGRVVTEEAQRRLPGLPVIFVTGYARVALPEDAVVVTKPFDLDLLARRLSFVFGRRL